jgi:hypothetical protein
VDGLDAVLLRRPLRLGAELHHASEFRCRAWREQLPLVGMVVLVVVAAVALSSAGSSRAHSAARPSVSDIAWAPGPSIAFDRASNIAGAVGVFVYRPSGPRRLLTHAGSPVWSPDGTRIAVEVKEGIATIRPDGSGLRVVARHAVQPRWSPNGRNPVIASVHTGRRWPIRIRPQPKIEAQLVCSTDGRRIAFTWPAGSSLDPTWGLYTVSARGGTPRQLLGH